MQRILRQDAMEYEFNYNHDPKLNVKQGEKFVIETEDAGSGMIRTPEIASEWRSLPTKQFEPYKGNPIGGPVYIEGAKRGDLLEISIEVYPWTLRSYRKAYTGTERNYERWNRCT